MSAIKGGFTCVDPPLPTFLQIPTTPPSGSVSTFGLQSPAPPVSLVPQVPAKLDLSVIHWNEDCKVCSAQGMNYVFKIVDACGDAQIHELRHERAVYEELARAGATEVTVTYYGAVTSTQGYEGIVLEKGVPCVTWEDIDRCSSSSFARLRDALTVFPVPSDEAFLLVQLLHRHSFVHGDLRPPNFVKTARGLRLIDLGRASRATQMHQRAELAELDAEFPV